MAEMRRCDENDIKKDTVWLSYILTVTLKPKKEEKK
ncbi:hypothetical protein SBFV2_gp20 [Sulfolobales Beppu filamentous virus 2]|uniref:Uncharacterized protein n=1 Tax=Sulfolobales Beppu filamentous virus 2 TaxID=2493123 RepID=A0A3Q8Q3R1_9VIRU|nr:hypothetical protein HOU84_gp20 [Sulfolobales Beppu filamentous virus 2]AZI75787.1 hypothetical protein SBFV2_gp20 [Sulfolobales Beppu filamentous virus 2]